METRQLTNGSGTVVDTYRYDAYARSTHSSGSDFNPFRYGGAVGYYTEGSPGMMLASHRWYSPELGRWMSRDPVGYAGGVNHYEYVSSNPVMLGDYEGESPVGWIVKLLKNGKKIFIRPVKDVSEARRLRRKGENFQAERERIAKQVEEGAFPDERQLCHKGHTLKDGSKGRPHYQTEGRPGHSFWSVATLGELLDPMGMISSDLDESDDQVDDETP